MTQKIPLPQNGDSIKEYDTFQTAEIQEVTTQLADTANELLFKSHNFEMYAHRGAEAYAPENTMKAFELALDLGFDGIELDTFPTTDGEWVVFHDDTVNRMTDGTGNIYEKTLAQVQALNITGGNYISWNIGPKIPTLRSVLELVKKKKKKAFVEVKPPFNASNLQTLTKLINELGMVDSAIIFSSYSVAQMLLDANSNLKMFIFYSDVAEFKDVARLKNVVGIMVYPYETLTTALFKELRQEYGKMINTGTLQDRQEAIRFADMGVDSIVGGVFDV